MKMLITFLTILFLSFPSVSKADTLVLVLDVSGSMSPESLALQFESYYNVLDQMKGKLANTHIVMYAFGRNVIEISNGNIDDAIFRMSQFVSYGLENVIQIDRSGTCIETALVHVYRDIPKFEYPIIVDISGDGAENCDGNPKAWSSKLLYDYGVIINSLPIAPENSIVYEFYDSEVTTGITIAGNTINNFEYALMIKLNMEIALLEMFYANYR